MLSSKSSPRFCYWSLIQGSKSPVSKVYARCQAVYESNQWAKSVFSYKEILFFFSNKEFLRHPLVEELTPLSFLQLFNADDLLGKYYILGNIYVVL